MQRWSIPLEGAVIHKHSRMPRFAVIEVLQSLYIPVKHEGYSALDPFWSVTHDTIRVLRSLDAAWEYLSEIDD